MFVVRMGKKSKYYVVWVGNTPGIYENWQDCQLQISGFPNATYKSFPTRAEAEDAYLSSPGFSTYSKPKALTLSKPTLKDYELFNIPRESFCVDAACSGNPGLMEYRGVWTYDRTELFHMGPIAGGTNNIGEFLALVHALAYFNKLNQKMVIYTDSKTAQAWVRNKHAKTTLQKKPSNHVLFTLIERAEAWLHNNTWQHTILKWKTEEWGEIPADFGRK